MRQIGRIACPQAGQGRSTGRLRPMLRKRAKMKGPGHQVRGPFASRWTFGVGPRGEMPTKRARAVIVPSRKGGARKFRSSPGGWTGPDPASLGSCGDEKGRQRRRPLCVMHAMCGLIFAAVFLAVLDVGDTLAAFADSGIGAVLNPRRSNKRNGDERGGDEANDEYAFQLVHF